MRIVRKILSLMVVIMMVSSQVLAGVHKVYNESDVSNAIVNDGIKGETNIILNFAPNYSLKTSEVKDMLSGIIKQTGRISLYVSSYSYSMISNSQDGAINKIVLTLNYYEKPEESKYVDTFISQNINNIIDGATNDFEKAFKINEWIRNNVAYDYTYKNNSSYNALVDKAVVCNGYAMLFDRMARAAGLETMPITGYARGGSHAWNAVKINGYWYFIDSTWNDTQAPNQYLLLSLNDISKYHKATSYIPQPLAQKSLFHELVDRITYNKDKQAFDTMSKIYGTFGYNKDVLFNTILKGLITNEEQTIIYDSNLYGSDLTLIVRELSQYFVISNVKSSYSKEPIEYNNKTYTKFRIKVDGSLKPSSNVPQYKDVGEIINIQEPKASITTKISHISIGIKEKINIKDYLSLVGIDEASLIFTRISGNSVTVDQTGIVTTIEPGESVILISGKSSEVSARITISVINNAFKITPKAPKITVYKGSEESIFNFISIENMKQSELVVESQDKAIADLSGTKLVGVGIGTTTIYVSNINDREVQIPILVEVIDRKEDYEIELQKIRDVEQIQRIGQEFSIYDYIKFKNTTKDNIGYIIIDNNGVLQDLGNGKLKYLKDGTAIIRVYIKNDESKYVDINVSGKGLIRQINLKASVIKGEIGSTINLMEYIELVNINKSELVVTEVTNNGGVSIDNLMLKLHKVGRAILKIYYTKNSKVFKTLTVNVGNKVTKISAPSQPITVGLGKIKKVNAYVNSDAINKELEYESLNNSVVTINEKGIVTGVKRGTATIRVYSKSNKYIYTDVKIIVK